jgi:hypothetical protein
VDRLHGLDPSPYVVGAREGLRDGVAQPLLVLIDESLDLARSLEGPETGQTGAADPELNLDLAFGPEGEDAQPTAPNTSEDDGSLAAFCFAIQHELGPVRNQLADTTADHELILVACDRACRKLRRSLSALAGALGAGRGRTTGTQDPWTDRASAAVAVRTIYTKFREALASGPDGTDASQVFAAMRRSATALAVLCGDEDFSEVRVQDRLLLRSLQRRTLAWGRSPDVRTGMQLYGDIRAAADLLRAINMRQELLAHDAQLIEEAALAIAQDGLSQPRLALLVGRMRALRGLDDELDQLLKRAYRGEGLDGLRTPLTDALHRLRAAFHRDGPIAG